MRRAVTFITAIFILLLTPSGCRSEELFPICKTFYTEAQISGIFEYKAIITNEYIEIESSVFTEKVRCQNGVITCGDFTAAHTQTQSISVFNLPELLTEILCGNAAYKTSGFGRKRTTIATFKEEEYSLISDASGMPQKLTWGGFTVVFSDFIFDKEAD